MAHATSLPRTEPRGNAWLLTAYTLWQREVVRFYRQPSRVVGVLASPLLFWLVLGSGFGTSLQTSAMGGKSSYIQYFFPGSLIMIVLFTSIFAMMSVIEDRTKGFLMSVLVAPVHRSAIAMGKILGGTTLAALQGLVFLVFAPFLGATITVTSLLLAAASIVLVAFALTAIGFAIAWKMETPQGFHAVINLFFIPLWLLSGAMFPITGAHGWIQAIMRLNPMTYAVEALRGALFPAVESSINLPITASLGILALFSAVVFVIAFVTANRRSTAAPL